VVCGRYVQPLFRSENLERRRHVLRRPAISCIRPSRDGSSLSDVLRRTFLSVGRVDQARREASVWVAGALRRVGAWGAGSRLEQAASGFPR